MSPIQPWEDQSSFYEELPTKYNPNLGKILVTGASGYIGGRLVPRLLDRGYSVRIMLRDHSPEYKKLWPKVEVAIGDALIIEKLMEILNGIDTAYYLIHSLHLGPNRFAKADIEAAKNFRIAANECGVKRIIYLGGLGDARSTLSEHLRSRLEVAQELQNGSVPVTIFRAAVIIGSGSASYEILKNLVEHLLIIPTPHWANSKCQPISVRDVIKYLIGALENEQTIGKAFDIGGKDVLTYKMMMKEVSKTLGKKRWFFHFPIQNIGFYSYFASFFTPVPASITKCLIEGLKERCSMFKPRY